MKTLSKTNPTCKKHREPPYLPEFDVTLGYLDVKKKEMKIGNISEQELSNLEEEAEKEKDIKFPINIPINFEDINVGVLKIDFECEEEKISVDKIKKKEFLIEVLSRKIENLMPILESVFELEFKLNEKYKDEVLKFLFISFWFGGFFSPGFRGIHQNRRTLLGNFLYTKESEIFEIIKSFGPTALCDENVQEKLHDWLLLDKDKARVNIEKLKKSLLEYGLGFPIEEKRDKTGRAPKDIKNISKQAITQLYNVYRLILKMVKMNKDYYGMDNIYKLIEQAGKDYIYSFKKAFEESKLNKVAYLVEALPPDLFSPISECIENNENLKREFTKFKWAPYDMAIKVQARLLGTSYQKIKDVLYRK